MINIEIRRLSSEVWKDFADLMQSDQQCSECWCLNHHIKTSCPTGGSARIVMAEKVARGDVHGLLAYHDSICVGWIAIDPIKKLDGHDCQESGKDGEWAIHCLFVEKGFRGQGVSGQLISEAVKFARHQGAAIVSAFPIPESSRGRYPAHEAEFSGRYSTYVKHGFRPAGDGSDFYQRMELELVTPSLKVEKMSNERRSDFFRVHCKENGEGWCNCVAWWVPTWEGWGERTAEQNLALRIELFDRREFDGYLLYLSGEPVGWCQAGPRDRLKKLVQQYRLESSPDTWAITCFVLEPKSRGKGYAQLFLKEVVADLFRSGVKHIQGFPKTGEQLDAGETWTGTERMFEVAGFTVERPHERFPVYGIKGHSN